MTSRFEEFTAAISTIYGHIQKIEREEMERYGLRGAYAQYLLAMERFPQGVTAAQLCDVCGKDKAAVSRMTAEMEAKGLLVREGGSAYRAPLLLTDAGREAARFVRQRAAVAVELAGRGLDDDRRAVFYEALHLISNNIQTLSEAGVPEAPKP